MCHDSLSRTCATTRCHSQASTSIRIQSAIQGSLSFSSSISKEPLICANVTCISAKEPVENFVLGQDKKALFQLSWKHLLISLCRRKLSYDTKEPPQSANEPPQSANEPSKSAKEPFAGLYRRVSFLQSVNPFLKHKKALHIV